MRKFLFGVAATLSVLSVVTASNGAPRPVTLDSVKAASAKSTGQFVAPWLPDGSGN